MKYYAQLIITTTSYSTALEQREEIVKNEFTQRNVNRWCEDYIADNYGSDADEQREHGAPDINCLGFVLTDEDGDEIETLYYRERRADYHGSHKTTH